MARQEVESVPPSMRPTRTKLDYDHDNITYRIHVDVFFGAPARLMNAVSVFFSDFLARAREKMDPDKSVVFAYDGV